MSELSSLRHALAVLIALRLFSEKEQECWNTLINTLDEQQLKDLWSLFEQENEGLDEAFSSLESYLSYYQTIRNRRLAFLKNIPGSDALLEPIIPFTDSELETLFTDKDHAAEILSTLSTIQIADWKEAIRRMHAESENIDGFEEIIQFLDAVQELAFEREKEVGSALTFLVEGIGTALTLHNRISQLKEIQSTIS